MWLVPRSPHGAVGVGPPPPPSPPLPVQDYSLYYSHFDGWARRKEDGGGGPDRSEKTMRMLLLQMGEG